MMPPVVPSWPRLFLRVPPFCAFLHLRCDGHGAVAPTLGIAALVQVVGLVLQGEGFLCFPIAVSIYSKMLVLPYFEDQGTVPVPGIVPYLCSERSFLHVYLVESC